MTSIDDEWAQYLNSDGDTSIFKDTCTEKKQVDVIEDVAPECQELYISTTTKVLFLNTAIDIDSMFWNLPILEYGIPNNGIVKKQMKIISKTPEDYDKYKERLASLNYYKEHIIKQIHNPSARRMKFKDERKITVGLSKKDIMNCRGKVKNAFYNCFAIIIRFLYEDIYKEIHVKVFNTGKLEIPGVLNERLLDQVKRLVLEYMQPYIEKSLYYIEKDAEENVLINSNFNCGYYINRDKLYSILRSDKYAIETAYDPCSYPGVKCKYYFNNNKPFEHNLQNGLIEDDDKNMKLYELDDNKKYTEISFMIFRTGSCLIVGNCTEKILRFVYDFIKNILQKEYSYIRVPSDIEPVKEKKEKLRKKTINVTKYY
jgi:hypothetical protein